MISNWCALRVGKQYLMPVQISILLLNVQIDKIWTRWQLIHMFFLLAIPSKYFVCTIYTETPICFKSISNAEYLEELFLGTPTLLPSVSLQTAPDAAFNYTATFVHFKMKVWLSGIV